MDNPIRWLGEIEPGDAALVGGKALQLATLARLGLPVPPGFVITTSALAEALGPVADNPTGDPDAVRARLERAPLRPPWRPRSVTLCQRWSRTRTRRAG